MVVTACHSGSALIRSVSSGTTIVSPGRISVDRERLNHPLRAPATTSPFARTTYIRLRSAF
jgi:hypothetical protein